MRTDMYNIAQMLYSVQQVQNAGGVRSRKIFAQTVAYSLCFKHSTIKVAWIDFKSIIRYQCFEMHHSCETRHKQSLFFNNKLNGIKINIKYELNKNII